MRDRRSSLRVLGAILVGAAVTSLGIALGSWQTRRGDEKAALQAQLDAAEAMTPVTVNSRAEFAQVTAQLPRRVRMQGQFLPERTVFIDNRSLNGVAGFQVVAPLRLPDGASVLVNRGWIARDARDPSLMPGVVSPTGSLEIEGLAVARVPRLLELAPPPSLRVPGIWPNLEPDDYEQMTGLTVARFVVQQTNASADNLQRVWVRPASGVEKHRGYALQWYGLAALSACLTTFFGARALRGTRP
ncbi:MAG TPA: SURF1 family protein [Burkholderiaceae bacterium]|nr:SURF1 family protein [Burkholderiaceae bacterium]